MKHIKLFFAVAILCAATFVGYNAYTNATMTEEERLIQANLEALSSGEGSTTMCDASNTNPCKIYSGGLLVAESTGAAIHVN